MADIITFDPAYFQELTKDLGNVSKSLGEAKASLQKATVGLDSGLVAFALCAKLNDDIKQVKKTADARVSETNGFSKALTGGITRVNSWETTTKNRESGLAAQLSKTWGFENGKFTGETGQTTAGTVASPSTSSNGANLTAQNMGSKYYSQNLSGVPRTLINDYDGKEHMNCVYYARSRAMEANGLDAYSPKGSGSEIQANSIAHFPGHDVFIENVERDASGQPTKVVFTESNWGGAADGHRVEMSYSEFVNRSGSKVNGYTYF
ncbi:MAG: hypothetical protein LBL05_00060 [Synergistaceae bacterium]|jgi:hypothetical protein|nr:hypothetical protein [Synergistaceae bacterium]